MKMHVRRYIDPQIRNVWQPSVNRLLDVSQWRTWVAKFGARHALDQVDSLLSIDRVSSSNEEGNICGVNGSSSLNTKT